MSGILTLPQKEFELGGTKYLITALGASDGLDVISKLSSSEVDGKFIKAVILRSVSVDGLKRDDKWFDVHFSRKYKLVQDLYEEILEFNLGDDPKEEGDTSGQL